MARKYQFPPKPEPPIREQKSFQERWMPLIYGLIATVLLAAILIYSVWSSLTPHSHQ